MPFLPLLSGYRHMKTGFMLIVISILEKTVSVNAVNVPVTRSI
jgi:hypothetical protein